MKKTNLSSIKCLPDSKRSQSEVITTVLLILLVITSVVILMNFVIPFVKNQLSGSDCFNVVDKIEITNNDMYTCYNSSLNSNELSVQVHIGDIADKISGFTISLGGASSKTYIIKNNTETTDVIMYDRTTTLLVLPEKNEERTYLIRGVSTKPDNIKVYPILINNKVCNSASTINSVSICGS